MATVQQMLAASSAHLMLHVAQCTFELVSVLLLFDELLYDPWFKACPVHLPLLLLPQRTAAAKPGWSHGHCMRQARLMRLTTVVGKWQWTSMVSH